MVYRSLIGAVALAGALSMSVASAQWPPDLSKYPDWNYQWYRVGPIGQLTGGTPPRGGAANREYKKFWGTPKGSRGWPHLYLFPMACRG